ncbi:MAG: 4Fe-4S dicluster domain-containing protein [Dehalococcoidia bacterium]|nr:4Fe-4S dicluster domain-containing protein [Dehalococcoidia bacterium]
MFQKEKPKDNERRRFLKGVGVTIAAGAMAALAACVPKVRKDQKAVLAAGVISHDPSECAGCGVCGLMCSLYHFGEQGWSLSASEVVRDPFEANYAFNVCQQCASPSCYFVCPLPDVARCIDEKTGARYVNAEKCIGCGKCREACPFKPTRVKQLTERKFAFNCDLCRNREQGPICVEYCTMWALTYVPAERRMV